MKPCHFPPGSPQQPLDSTQSPTWTPAIPTPTIHLNKYDPPLPDAFVGCQLSWGPAPSLDLFQVPPPVPPANRSCSGLVSPVPSASQSPAIFQAGLKCHLSPEGMGTSSPHPHMALTVKTPGLAVFWAGRPCTPPCCVSPPQTCRCRRSS